MYKVCSTRTAVSDKFFLAPGSKSQEVEEVKQDREAEEGNEEEEGDVVNLISSNQNQSFLKDWCPKQVSECLKTFHLHQGVLSLKGLICFQVQVRTEPPVMVVVVAGEEVGVKGVKDQKVVE